MEDDPFSGLGGLPFGLRPIAWADRPLFDARFASLLHPLSDYTFAQLFTWRNSLRILWKEIRGHLCVFANGTGDLTLLMPPIGDPAGALGAGAALAEAFDLMDAYNREHGLSPERSLQRARVEYASEELLARLDLARLDVTPMGGDYVYESARMIDLAGSALASKRQLKNRFARLYDFRVEPYDPARHLDDCRRLLTLWKNTQDAHHNAEPSTSALKRQKEATATLLALEQAPALGLAGLVVYARPRPGADAGADADAARVGGQGGELALSGFTFGEELGADQSSIVIEKTDLAVRGLAQFIFSEFVRQRWSHRPLVNAGDDWGLDTLSWTKQSYRPVKMLRKFVLTLARTTAVSVPAQVAAPAADVACPLPAPPLVPVPVPVPVPQPVVPSVVTIRPATRADLPGALALEQACFSSHQLSKRSLAHLQGSASAIFLVAADGGGAIAADCIALVRRNRRSASAGPSGRIYSLAVDAGHRRQGLGQRLLSAMIDELAARGARRVYLEVAAENAAALALYARLGFRSIGSLPHYYGRGEHAEHLMLTLPAMAPAGG